jgi:hypothetical protein
MKKKIIISCSVEIDDLKCGRLFNVQIAAIYPGSLWALSLKDLCLNTSYQVLTSDVVLSDVNSGKINIENVLVLQQGLDLVSSTLIQMGATPFMIMNFESPLYSGKFYDLLPILEKKFYNSLVFSSSGLASERRSNLRFPSFSISQIGSNSPSDWSSRGFASMVVANKYVPLQRISDITSLEDFIWLLLMRGRRFFRGPKGKIYKDLYKLQLQDKRLEVIDYFSSKKDISLYGGGWNSLWKLPPKYRKSLGKNLQGNINRVKDKIKTLSKYKFNFCFENVRFPGYVTEKIFDAMLAGTVPVYYGAPDICKFVPKECFIDASSFDSMEDLYNNLINLSDYEANKIIENGYSFLSSVEGSEYSYEGVAQEIFNKIKKYEKS